MSVQPTTVRSARGSPSRPYAQISLVELIERIVEASDAAAVRELHDHRTPFRIGGQQRRLTLTAFVAALCEMPWAQRLCGYDRLVAERAFDLTIDRFSSIPLSEDAPCGPDCRLYFASVLKTVREWVSRRGSAAGLDVEAVTARILQQRVTSHAWLCCKEARRSCNPTRSRFAWQMNGAVIHVWMPVSVAGGDRRRWLEAQLPDVDLRRPGERARIQAIVDDRFGIARFVPLPADLAAVQTLHIENDMEEGPFELDSFVAEEKASLIHKQRPRIRALGPERLMALIRRIFQAIAAGEYDEKKFAAEFAISRATLSRFAGIRWRSTTRFPDLWVNTAHTLAAHGRFVEAAMAAGVWDLVQAVVGNHTNANLGEHADE